MGAVLKDIESYICDWAGTSAYLNVAVDNGGTPCINPIVNASPGYDYQTREGLSIELFGMRIVLDFIPNAATLISSTVNPTIGRVFIVYDKANSVLTPSVLTSYFGEANAGLATGSPWFFPNKQWDSRYIILRDFKFGLPGYTTDVSGNITGWKQVDGVANATSFDFYDDISALNLVSKFDPVAGGQAPLTGQIYVVCAAPPQATRQWHCKMFARVVYRTSAV